MFLSLWSQYSLKTINTKCLKQNGNRAFRSVIKNNRAQHSHYTFTLVCFQKAVDFPFMFASPVFSLTHYATCIPTTSIRQHFQDSLFPPPVSSYFNVEASPEDMAEYIFFTKDDKSVTQAIEKLIQEERVSMITIL